MGNFCAAESDISVAHLQDKERCLMLYCVACNMNQGGRTGGAKGAWPSKFLGTKTASLFSKRTIKQCYPLGCPCPGPLHQGHLTVLPSISAGPMEATHKARLRAIEAGHYVSSKNPSRVQERDEGIAERKGRETC